MEQHEANDVDTGEYEGDTLRLQAMLDEIKPQLAQADRKLRRIVRRNPFVSLAVVTLAGFVVGRLLRSR